MNGRAIAFGAALVAAAALSCSKTRISRILPPGARVDVFPQNAAAKLDALFVVDNAKFMHPHQQKVADSFHRFLDYLAKNQIDWHIGLLTTDVVKSPGQFQGGGDAHYFANGGEAQIPPTVLAMGEGGGSIAPTLEQLDLALRNPPANFVRADAALFLVAVTDDDDPWSPGDDLYYFRSFKQSKGAGNDGIVTFSALAGDLPAGCSIPDPSNPSSSFYSAPANRLSAFAAKMGGLFHSVCDPSFDQVFDDLGATAAGLKRTFRLAKVPDVATLVVDVRARCDSPQSALAFCQSVNDECSSGEPGLVCTPKADAFTFDAPTNSLVFTAQAVPPRGSQVEAQYSEQGTGAAQ